MCIVYTYCVHIRLSLLAPALGSCHTLLWYCFTLLKGGGSLQWIKAAMEKQLKLQHCANYFLVHTTSVPTYVQIAKANDPMCCNYQAELGLRTSVFVFAVFCLFLWEASTQFANLCPQWLFICVYITSNILRPLSVDDMCTRFTGCVHLSVCVCVCVWPTSPLRTPTDRSVSITRAWRSPWWEAGSPLTSTTALSCSHKRRSWEKMTLGERLMLKYLHTYTHFHALSM